MKCALVPVEPTAEMLKSAILAFHNEAKGQFRDNALQVIWAAMLDASPLSVHDLKPGLSTVFLRTDAPPTLDEVQRLRMRLPAGVQLIVLESNATLEELNEDAMRAAGWVRSLPCARQYTLSGPPTRIPFPALVVSQRELEALPAHQAEYYEVVMLKCPRAGCEKSINVSWGDLERDVQHICSCGYHWRIAGHPMGSL